MNYLIALLAFAAVMIVLATLATVVVEAIHKLANKRAADFEQMLTKLYDDAVAPRLKEAQSDALRGARDFARELIKNPAFHERKNALLQRIPVLKNLFSPAFENLTTRQFVEQLARTQVGRALAAKVDSVNQEKETEIKAVLKKLAYEFERYGDAAGDYFKRRAAVLSVVVAFFIAFIVNVDAILLYKTLATDRTLAQDVVTTLDVDKLEEVYKQAIQGAGGDTAAQQSIGAEYQAVRDQIRADTERLEGLGLPIEA